MPVDRLPRTATGPRAEQHQGMVNDSNLEEWVAGFFEGEGCIHYVISNKEKPYSHVKIEMKQFSSTYVSGLFDAEGTISQDFEKVDSGIGHYQYPSSRIKLHGDSAVATMEKLGEYCHRLGISSNVSEEIREKEEWSDGLVFRISNIDGVEKFLESIYPYLVVKKTQASIMKDQIIPRIREGRHTTKKGFLEVTAWADAMNSMKGGERGDYNLEYFEDLWDMKLPGEKKPDITQEIPEFDPHKNTNGIKEW